MTFAERECPDVYKLPAAFRIFASDSSVVTFVDRVSRYARINNNNNILGNVTATRRTRAKLRGARREPYNSYFFRRPDDENPVYFPSFLAVIEGDRERS